MPEIVDITRYHDAIKELETLRENGIRLGQAILEDLPAGKTATEAVMESYERLRAAAPADAEIIEVKWQTMLEGMLDGANNA